MAKATTNAQGTTTVSDLDFIKINVQAAKEGKGIKWIAEQTKLSPQYVQQRRNTLRNRGVALPQLPKGGGGNGKGFNLEESLNLLAELTGEDIAKVKKESRELLKKVEERKAAANATS